MNGTISTAAGVRRYMRALGSKAARRSMPVLVYEGERGYALGAYTADGVSVYAGNTATAHAAARGELVPVRATTGARIDALLSAGGELAEVVRAADHIGGTDSLRPIDLAGSVSVELVGHGYAAAGLTWTARAASRDTATRPIMAAVVVDAYTGPMGLRPRYVAADNYRLHVYGDHVPASEHTGLVPYQLAEYVAAAISGAIPWRRRGPSGASTAWIGRGVAKYYGEGGRSILMLAQGVAVRVEDKGARSSYAGELARSSSLYPDYRAGIIPAAGTHTAMMRLPSGDVDRGLRRALDVAKLVAARAGDKLAAERATLALGPEGLAIAALTGRPADDGAALHVQSYAIAPTGSGEATMAAEYVLDALADRHGADVELLLHGEYRPVIITGVLAGGASEYMAVIMPLRGVRDSRAAEAAGIEARELVAAGA
jgi:hypothetical protein